MPSGNRPTVSKDNRDPQGAYSTPKKSKFNNAGLHDDLRAQLLASNLKHRNDTPSKVTDPTCALTHSEGVNSTESHFATPTKKPSIQRVSARRNASNAPHTDDSLPKHCQLTFEWTAEDAAVCEVAIAESLHLRLRSSFKRDPSLFYPTVKGYLKRKFVEAGIYSFLYSVPVSFYVMAKEVFSMSHEFFADAVNFSGALPHFCSADNEDSMFGSSGPWEEVENEVHGGAGFPPFTRKRISKVIESCEKHVRKVKPYFRLFLLPFHEESPLRAQYHQGSFYGEVIARFAPGSLALRHQMDILQAEKLCTHKEWSPLVETALTVWVNEPYRILYPVPMDIDDCLTIWTDEFVGDASGLDFAALWRAFPRQSRTGDERADIFEQLPDMHHDV